MIGTNAALIGRFIASPPELPESVREAALRCLVDWMGVTIAGAREPVARAIMRYAGLAHAPVLGAEDAERGALVNGTAAHALDFDDTHIPTDTHFSAVIWSALLALAKPCKTDGAKALRAFAVGYEVAAKLAGRRVGFSLQFRWFHPTGILGHIAAAAAVAAFEGLDEVRAVHAVALATTQAAGLRGTLGSMAKPVQVGRAAANGIACVRMAQAGIDAGLDIIEPQGGFARAFIQDNSAQLAALRAGDLGSDWAVLRTSFKPYACLHGIHPSIDAARDINVNPGKISAVRVYVAPGVKQVARYSAPETPLQAKFSVEYCVALALTGRNAGAPDFAEVVLADPTLRRLLPLIEVIPEEGRKMLDSAIEIDLVDDTRRRGETALSRGHPGNPMEWAELEAKFTELANPVLGGSALELLELLQKFDSPGMFEEVQTQIRNPI